MAEEEPDAPRTRDTAQSGQKPTTDTLSLSGPCDSTMNFWCNDAPKIPIYGYTNELFQAVPANGPEGSAPWPILVSNSSPESRCLVQGFMRVPAAMAERHSAPM